MNIYQDLSQRSGHHGNLILINGFGAAILGLKSSGTDVEVMILCGRISTDMVTDAPRTSTVPTRQRSSRTYTCAQPIERRKSRSCINTGARQPKEL
ncbi:hypothetical protein Pmani_022486 [Petrolisthes manimaculis]|uniref:Uncharacterized protein n=1 Tax=Petrolisthes manimaculis TaxID=1843537 RepID=A0AAE1U228_9EUCA|nr:hypothetical protein Pmani_022486 [Petrolisthes manimaculis]